MAEDTVTPEAARGFLTEFGHSADTLKTLPDEKVLEVYGTASAAHKKHLDAATAKSGERWRENYAARLKANAEKSGDKTFDEAKLLGRLQRYAGPDAAFDALIGLQNKVSAGELRSVTPFPEKGTDEQKTEWRKANGLPGAADGYQIKLPAGMALGEEDKPAVDSFLKAAHSANIPPSQVSAAVKWYLDFAEEQAAARHQADNDLVANVEDALRAEWGGDYRKNKSLIEALLDQGGEDVKEAFFGARLSDGTPLLSHLPSLRYLIDRAREVIDSTTLVPGDGASMGKSVDDELRQLQELMRAPRGSPEYRKYWGDPRAQARYRELVNAKEKMAKRKAA